MKRILSVLPLRTNLTENETRRSKRSAKYSLLAGAALAAAFGIILLSAIDCFARAGGAGGGGSSSSDSGDAEIIIYLVIQIIRLILMLPFPLNIIAVAVLVLAALYFYKKGNEVSALNDIPSPGVIKKSAADKILVKDPSFSRSEFIKKVETAFYRIQKAWEAKDISSVRIFISDGVYQRFNSQFLMMNLINQTNKINRVEIESVFIDSFQRDGEFDIIQVGIDAYIEETFQSSYHELCTSNREHFREYWSFMRKRGIESHDLYSAECCPNCSANLDFKLGEISRCQYCGTIFNSGEYDWVLAEITQSQDYSIESKAAAKQLRFDDKIRKIAGGFADFSVQHIEDIASNAYLQIVSAQTLQNPMIARRFMSDDFFAKWITNFEEAKSGDTPQTVYNRLYLNSVSLAGFYEVQDSYIAALSIRRSYQRVLLNNSKISLLDHGVVSDRYTLFMQRSKSGETAKASLYAHLCPVCAAPVADSIDITCRYCSSSLNDPAHEWIVSGLYEGADYSDYLQSLQYSSGAAIKGDIYDAVYEVRDFAFNNLLAVLGCDGRISDEELAFAKKSAKRLGFSTAKVQPMLDLAVTGALAVRMPEGKRKRERIIKVMERAAMADNNYSDIEREYISSIREKYS